VQLALLANHAYEMAHAVAITLVRLGTARGRRLEWETAAAVSAYVFDTAGFAGVSVVAAAFTALIPVSCIWLRERRAV